MKTQDDLEAGTPEKRSAFSKYMSQKRTILASLAAVIIIATVVSIVLLKVYWVAKFELFYFTPNFRDPQ